MKLKNLASAGIQIHDLLAQLFFIIATPSFQAQPFSCLSAQALTENQYYGGPCNCCYSHSFSHQQSNPEPVHTGVSVNLLDWQVSATEPGLLLLLFYSSSTLPGALGLIPRSSSPPAEETAPALKSSTSFENPFGLTVSTMEIFYLQDPSCSERPPCLWLYLLKDLYS